MRLLNIVSTPQNFCNDAVEYMLEERDVEQFQQVEICTGGTRVASGFVHPGACITRPDRATGNVERER
jgi:hypothetical protein